MAKYEISVTAYHHESSNAPSVALDGYALSAWEFALKLAKHYDWQSVTVVVSLHDQVGLIVLKVYPPQGQPIYGGTSEGLSYRSSLELAINQFLAQRKII